MRQHYPPPRTLPDGSKDPVGGPLDSLSPEYQAALTWLGSKEWLRWGRNSSGGLTVYPDRSLLERVTARDFRQYGLDFLKMVATDFFFNKRLTAADLALYLVKSRLLAGGPKIVRPDADECAALAHTAANIPFSDYRQPYSSLIIEWPRAWRLPEQPGSPSVSHTLIHHEHDQGVIIVAHWLGRNMHLMQWLAQEGGLQDMRGKELGGDGASYATIDVAIRGARRGPTVRPGESEAIRLLARLAVNLCLLLVNYGHREAGPADPEAHRRWQRQARGLASRRRAEAAKRALAREAVLIRFSQNVTLFTTADAPARGPSGSHRPSPGPHWRRGHIRHQRCGPGNSQTRLVFIRPVLVRRSAFAGELTDTRVAYEVRP